MYLALYTAALCSLITVNSLMCYVIISINLTRAVQDGMFISLISGGTGAIEFG